MTTKTEIQALLRFLSQDARIPLPTAMSKIKELQSAKLTSSDSLAKSSITAIQAVFTDEKLAKQVLSAAKRVSKKRGREPGGIFPESPAKRKKTISTEDAATPAAIEESLTLPESNADEEELAKTILHTNRAPLVLAFATKLLEFTMPSQPLSSRLSLAQAVVSVNARTKAISLGIEKGISAEDDGWGQGQPKVRVMGRDIRVMKRWDYGWKGEKSEQGTDYLKAEDSDALDSQKTLKQEDETDNEPALWGLDLEALRSSNGPLVSGAHGAKDSGLPVYTAQSARAYLLKSFASMPCPMDDASLPKKKSAAMLKAEKEQNLGLILQALDLVFRSWAGVLSREELDKRVWAWYVTIRPEVENGVAGWGGKGEVKLSQMLNLRRKG
ncbi:MAG: hypothetical protein ASARMPREDX12_003816 [Alectoria sarmentosa]|nr:MAG: hypothetical protein ASARMPREDX12_003816 [Alectoria sarmentosa]